MAEKVVNTLRAFYDATKILSSAHACISSYIPVVTTIIVNLEAGNDDHGVKTYRKNLKNSMENRFDSDEGTRGVLAVQNVEAKEELAVATFLDPRYKDRFFRHSDTVSFVKNILRKKLKKMICQPEQESKAKNDNNNPTTSTASSHETFKETMLKLQGRSKGKSSRQFCADKVLEIEMVLDHYCEETCMDDEEADPLNYWELKSHSRNPIDKQLAELACYYLTPPPTSVDVERLFSTGGDIFTAERNRTLPTNGKKLLFLRENIPVLMFQY